MPLLSYFGFGRDNISEGRRRFVVLMAFLSFVLLIAATVAPNWVAGGPSGWVILCDILLSN